MTPRDTSVENTVAIVSSTEILKLLLQSDNYPVSEQESKRKSKNRKEAFHKLGAVVFVVSVYVCVCVCMLAREHFSTSGKWRKIGADSNGMVWMRGELHQIVSSELVWNVWHNIIPSTESWHQSAGNVGPSTTLADPGDIILWINRSKWLTLKTTSVAI